MIHAMHAESGAPILYVARVPADSPVPDRFTRRSLELALPAVLSKLSSYHVVMEGQGFGAALKRSVLTAALQPFWRRRLFYVHSTLAEVEPSLSRSDGERWARLWPLLDESNPETSERA
jgi:hypothetical protein